jgi:integrase
MLDCRIDGERHVVKLGKGITLADARKIAAVKRGEIHKDEAGIGKKRLKDMPIDRAVEDYLKTVATDNRENTFKSYRDSLAEIKKSFAGKWLSDVCDTTIQAHKNRRKAEDCLVSCNRELAALSAMFTWAIEHKPRLFDGPNPVLGVARFEEHGRIRFLDDAEEAALMAELEEPLRTMALMGIHTGLRLQSEAFPLKWKDLNLKSGKVVVFGAYAKNKDSRTVKLNSAILPALQKLKASADKAGRGGAEDYVFQKPDGGRYKSIRTAFNNAVSRAKLENVTPHVTRHTFASRLRMAGVDLLTIQKLGGWSSIDMVQRYAHIGPNVEDEAVEKIAGKVPSNFTTPEKQAPADVALTA